MKWYNHTSLLYAYSLIQKPKAPSLIETTTQRRQMLNRRSKELSQNCFGNKSEAIIRKTSFLLKRYISKTYTIRAV
jgi:hypothetical protein